MYVLAEIERIAPVLATVAYLPQVSSPIIPFCQTFILLKKPDCQLTFSNPRILPPRTSTAPLLPHAHGRVAHSIPALLSAPFVYTIDLYLLFGVFIYRSLNIGKL